MGYYYWNIKYLFFIASLHFGKKNIPGAWEKCALVIFVLTRSKIANIIIEHVVKEPWHEN